MKLVPHKDNLAFIFNNASFFVKFFNNQFTSFFED